MYENHNAKFMTVRGYQLDQIEELTPSLEDYLEMTYRLCLIDNYTRIGKLSSLLNVRPSSVSKMIAKLYSLGYVEYDHYEVIKMTKKGQIHGEYLLKRHDIIDEFLILIGCQDRLKEVELIEHAISPITLNRIGLLNAFFNENQELLKVYQKFKSEHNQ